MKRIIYLAFVPLFLLSCENKAEPQSMAKHYEKNNAAIVRLDAYVTSVIPDTCDYSAELEDGSLFTTNNQGRFYMEQPQRDTLKILLCEAGCIGFRHQPGKPNRIWRARPNWLDLCWYEILPQPMTDEQWNSYLDAESYLPYNDTVAFGYGGPAFGTDKMPGKEDFIKKNRIKRR